MLDVAIIIYQSLP